MLWNTPESLSEKLPYCHTQSRLCITADARIDNREELFAKLDLPKSRAAEIADSQLILKAYQKYGEDCVQHVMYAKYNIGRFFWILKCRYKPFVWERK